MNLRTDQASVDESPVRGPTNSDGTAGRVLRLALKELRETLRDRRTIATLVLMPLLIYPLLSIAFQKFLLTNLRPPQELVYRIGVESERDKSRIARYLMTGAILLSATATDEPKAVENADAGPNDADDEPPPAATPKDSSEEALAAFELQVVSNLEAEVARQTVDLGIRITRTERLNVGRRLGRAIDCELLHVNTSDISRRALAFVERRLQSVNQGLLEYQLRRAGVEQRTVPVRMEAKSVQPSGGPAAFSLATLVPLILILMTITGAVYPAIDLTAGERERGTLEILVAAPVPRLGLLLAKYVAVLMVALLTATVNLVSMSVTILSIGLGPLLFGETGLSLGVVAEVFGLLILFAAFFSAVLLALTSFARSFKEAQAYLIPLMLVSIAPGMLSMIPGLKLSGLLAAAPLVNIVLLARDLFEHQADPLVALVVVFSTGLYALGAITVAARIFGTDAILYGSPGTWSDLFLRPAEPSPAASVTSALLCLGLMFPAHFLLVHLLRLLTESPMELLLLLQSLIAVGLFGVVPLAAALLNRVKLRSGFRLRGTGPWAYLAAVLLALSLWPFVFELVLLTEKLGLVSLGDEQLQWGKILLERLQRVSPVWLLLSLAVVPAVVEEFFFRGYLFGALDARTTAWRTILISAVLFGLFHLIVKDELAVERLLPSTLLGVVLGWVCHRSGSLFPGIVLHACHNGLLLMVARYEKELTSWGLFAAAQGDHLPLGLLFGAALCAGAGFVLLQSASSATSTTGLFDDKPHEVAQ